MNEERQSKVKKVIKDHQIKAFVTESNKVHANYPTLFALVIGNCSDAVASSVKGKEDFESKKSCFDVTWFLLGVFKDITAGVHTNDNKHSTLHDATLMLYTTRQMREESNDAYLSHFKAKVQSVKAAGGVYAFSNPFLVGAKTNTEIKDYFDESNDAKRLKDEEEMLAVMFIKRSCENRYSRLHTMMEEGSTVNHDVYPKSLAEAYEMMTKYIQIITNTSRGGRSFCNGRSGRGRNGRMFAQQGRGGNSGATKVGEDSEATAGSDGCVFDTVKCFA